MKLHSVAFSATLPYPLKGCCPDPITSNSGNVLSGVASYYGIFQHRFLSIVCPAAKVYDLVLGDSAAIPLIFSLLLRLGSGYTPVDLCRARSSLHGFNFQGLFRVDVTTY